MRTKRHVPLNSPVKQILISWLEYLDHFGYFCQSTLDRDNVLSAGWNADVRFGILQRNARIAKSYKRTKDRLLWSGIYEYRNVVQYYLEWRDDTAVRQRAASYHVKNITVPI